MNTGQRTMNIGQTTMSVGNTAQQTHAHYNTEHRKQTNGHWTQDRQLWTQDLQSNKHMHREQLSQDTDQWTQHMGHWPQDRQHWNEDIQHQLLHTEQWIQCAEDLVLPTRTECRKTKKKVIIKVVAFSSPARTLEECSTIHSPSVLFFFFF